MTNMHNHSLLALFSFRRSLNKISRNQQSTSINLIMNGRHRKYINQKCLFDRKRDETALTVGDTTIVGNLKRVIALASTGICMI